ncbi:hypothetical protein GCM10009560_13010 [Nonomuraea longicatena]|uniref:Uncharacterized protein n=1 Tax=Nonomuraea longicatena TaxID=83682 RepID=A0ABN1NV55_9ACTN
MTATAVSGISPFTGRADVNACLSPHLPKPQPGCTRLVWIAARNEPRRQTLLWTCHCDDVAYELCASGGQTFLRREDTRFRKVAETHRMRMKEGHTTWQALLQGHVR